MALQRLQTRVLKDSSGQRLPKWWLSSKTLEKTAEVMAVLKDCDQRLLKDSWEKFCRKKTAEVMAVFKDYRKECWKVAVEKKFAEVVFLWKPLLKSIFFSPGRRDRTFGFDNPLVTSCWSDAQNCGKTLPSDPSSISCVLEAQNCGKMQIFNFAAQPARHFMRVGRSKLW